jgi:adenosylcobinamide-GDP ribazoletransferase
MSDSSVEINAGTTPDTNLARPRGPSDADDRNIPNNPSTSDQDLHAADPRAYREYHFAQWQLQVRLAISFLTIFPVGPVDAAASTDVAASFGWFPLVGFGIGLTLCAVDWLLTPLLGPALRAVLLVLILTALTGALHLDGVADTADALGAGRDRERALEILRDSRIGSFGAIALFFVLAFKIIAIAGAGESQRYAMLYMAPGLGRWAMVALANGLDYLRAEGLGTAILSRDRRRNLLVATVTAVIALAPLMMLHALRACLIAAAITLALSAFYRRWLDGLTGDLIGAVGELVETAVLIGLAG